MISKILILSLTLLSSFSALAQNKPIITNDTYYLENEQVPGYVSIYRRVNGMDTLVLNPLQIPGLNFQKVKDFKVVYGETYKPVFFLLTTNGDLFKLEDTTPSNPPIIESNVTTIMESEHGVYYSKVNNQMGYLDILNSSKSSTVKPLQVDIKQYGAIYSMQLTEPGKCIFFTNTHLVIYDLEKDHLVHSIELDKALKPDLSNRKHLKPLNMVANTNFAALTFEDTNNQDQIVVGIDLRQEQVFFWNYLHASLGGIKDAEKMKLLSINDQGFQFVLNSTGNGIVYDIAREKISGSQKSTFNYHDSGGPGFNSFRQILFDAPLSAHWFSRGAMLGSVAGQVTTTVTSTPGTAVAPGQSTVPIKTYATQVESAVHEGNNGYFYHLYELNYQKNIAKELYKSVLIPTKIKDSRLIGAESNNPVWFFLDQGNNLYFYDLKKQKTIHLNDKITAICENDGLITAYNSATRELVDYDKAGGESVRGAASLINTRLVGEPIQMQYIEKNRMIALTNTTLMTIDFSSTRNGPHIVRSVPFLKLLPAASKPLSMIAAPNEVVWLRFDDGKDDYVMNQVGIDLKAAKVFFQYKSPVSITVKDTTANTYLDISDNGHTFLVRQGNGNYDRFIYDEIKGTAKMTTLEAGVFSNKTLEAMGALLATDVISLSIDHELSVHSWYGRAFARNSNNQNSNLCQAALTPTPLP